MTIACIGTNSGTGEEWADKENALTAAEAQAFKRSLSCFGLGRYLYDIDGEWVGLDQHGAPTLDGAKVPLRYIGEQHVKEDLGRIPTVQDWLRRINPERWMYGNQQQPCGK